MKKYENEPELQKQEKTDVDHEKKELQELYEKKREMISEVLNEIDKLENFDFSKISSKFNLSINKEKFREIAGNCVKPISNAVEVDLPLLKKVTLQLCADLRSWTNVYMLAKLELQKPQSEQEKQKISSARIGDSSYIDESKVAEGWFSLGSTGDHDFTSDPEFFNAQPYQKKEMKELTNEERMQKEIEWTLNSWRRRTKEPYGRINSENGYGPYVPNILFENPFEGDEETEFQLRASDRGSSVSRESIVRGITNAKKEVDKLGWEVYNSPQTNKNARVTEVISAEGLKWVKPVYGSSFVKVTEKSEVL